MIGMTRRTLSILQIENSKKDQVIEELEGDLTSMGNAQSTESFKYMRHTLVKFLCNSSVSERQMILPAVSELLKLK